MAVSRALTSTAPVGLYPLTGRPHCSSSGLQILHAAGVASSAQSAPGADPSPGSPGQQNHLLRLPNKSFKGNPDVSDFHPSIRRRVPLTPALGRAVRSVVFVLIQRGEDQRVCT